MQLNDVHAAHNTQAAVRYKLFIIAAMALFPIIAFILYKPALHGGFILDDTQNIAFSKAVQMEDLSLKSLADSALKAEIKRRPIANITFALNYWLDGYNTYGYHLFNLFIHVVSAVLLFFLMGALMQARENSIEMHC